MPPPKNVCMTHLLVVGPGLVSTSPDSSSNNITTTEMKDCSNWTPITEDDSNTSGIVELLTSGVSTTTAAWGIWVNSTGIRQLQHCIPNVYQKLPLNSKLSLSTILFTLYSRVE